MACDVAGTLRRPKSSRAYPAGFGNSHFLSADVTRTANSGILAMDMKALIDALGIEKLAVVGHDWGASVAEALQSAGRANLNGSLCYRALRALAECRPRLSIRPS